MIYEKKITKKEIFSYAIFIAIIALICIFKNEIWEFVKFIFSNLDFICGNFANFVGEDNIVFFTTLLKESRLKSQPSLVVGLKAYP